MPPFARTVELEPWPTPLAGLPSVLALADLRRTVRKGFTEQGNDAPRLARLLELDPLTLLRCMRVLHAPLNGAKGLVLGVPQLAERLGPTLLRRAFDTPTAPTADSARLRQLWLHSVFGAIVARDLAATRGTLDPDRAYVLGLLHDLDAWAEEVARWRGAEGGWTSSQTWIARWNLPLELSTDLRRGSTSERDLIRIAHELATRAGFPAPAGDKRHADGEPLVTSMDELVRATGLRAQFESALGQFGLSPTLSLRTPEGSPPAQDQLAERPAGRLAELCATLATGHRNTKARKLLIASTNAALRYLEFDRAHAVRWIAALNRCWIWDKADGSPRTLKAPMLQPTPAERIRLTAAINTGRPQVLVNDHDSTGLMSNIGADEALLVPLNTSFQVPTVLVLDRTLSGAPLDPRLDGREAEALGSITSLLQENLLLTRQRKRAMKFSVTDPLTRLSNRGVGINSLRQEIARSNRTAAPLSVLMLDLDHFKDLNDEYGHVVGDQALRTTGEVLRRGTRRMDTAVRYGGEEFLVILPGTGLDEAAVIATRLQVALYTAGDQLGLPLSASLGLAGFIHGEDSVESLLSRADHALYASKGRGRNRFSIDGEGALPT